LVGIHETAPNIHLLAVHQSFCFLQCHNFYNSRNGSLWREMF